MTEPQDLSSIMATIAKMATTHTNERKNRKCF